MVASRPDNKDNSPSHWFISDHFAEQWSNPASHSVIINRWAVWKIFLKNWLAANKIQLENSFLHTLDAGCGDGINVMGLQQIMHEWASSFAIHAVDYNRLRLKRVRDRFPNVAICLADLLHIPYQTDRFHVILCNHVLEHIPLDVKALLELRRVLHPQGLLIIGVPNEGCLLAQVRNKIFQPAILRTTDHVHFYTWGKLEYCLKQAGLKLVDKKFEWFFTPHTKLHQILMKSCYGRSLLLMLKKFLPQQSGEIIMCCRKK